MVDFRRFAAEDVVKARAQAEPLIRRFDRNGDGKLSAAEQSKPERTRSYDLPVERFSDTHVWRTTVTEEVSQVLRRAEELDANRDGSVDADELALGVLRQVDGNGDGKLGMMERWGAKWQEAAEFFLGTETKEVARSRKESYEPVQQQVSPTPSRPSYDPYYDRPWLNDRPIWDDPYHVPSRPSYDPYYDRPSSWDRPRPPSVPSSPSYDLPSYDRPRPPSSSSPSHDRPTPPGSSSGDRPRPPSL